MPRDDNPPPASEAADSSSNKAPLKRGDACLYCRKRRIRCSATKPSCQHCTKLKRECVYDTGKPVSRVKQLEDKVAELEGMLKTGLLDPNGNAAGASGPPPLIHHSSSDASNTSIGSGGGGGGTSGFGPSQGEGTIDTNMLNMFSNVGPGNGGYFPPSFGGSVFSQYGGSVFHSQAMPNQQPIEELFDFSTLDPNLMSLINDLSSTSTGPVEPIPVSNSVPPPAPHPQQNSMDFDYTGPTGLTPFLETAPPVAGFSPATTSSNSQPSYPNSASGHPYQQGAGASFSPTPPTSMPQSTGSSYQAYVSDSSANIFTNPNPSNAFPTSANNPVVQNVLGVHGPHPSATPLSTSANSLPQPAHGATGGPGWKGEENLDEMPLVGGWFDAADLPKVARDHLLDLFFSGMRLFGQEFHVPRFMASLTLPAAKRPHPCLLYSMYLLASRISTSPPIRNLETHFYTIASKQLEESIAKADRLLDATRAACQLAVYKYSLARYHEGWMMTGQAARLAISCGLHQIPSSQFRPSTIPAGRAAELMGVVRQRSFVLPPPQDSIELAERIWTFWSIFTVDRCGSISAQWPPAIPDDVVITPYPRPLHEYELDLINEDDEDSISSLWESGPRTTLPHYNESTAVILRLRSLAILERSSKLMYLKPERGWEDKLPPSSRASPASKAASSPLSGIDEYLSYQNKAALGISGPSLWGQSPASESGKEESWMRTPRIRTPKAYEEVRQALLRVEQDLPPERRTNWECWDGNVQDWHFSPPKQDVYTLHFILGCAWMFLFDVFSFGASNDKAVTIARRLVFSIRALARENLSGELDVFIAMCWSFIVKILIREVKRLQAIGDIAATEPLENDIDAVVSALKIFGQRYNIAQMQAVRADRYRKSNVEDLMAMEKEGDEADYKRDMDARCRWKSG
ncbi:hypothetical protein BCR39DRAFT_513615 [Naematelia encephala]|uniref:Zn(2)-C6 fungal-type domain-containing protein n=1 Tax=Naematelia encephala TaxID=71784 RepID=A0A1Y2BII9_9TREE|nr:hypothetical protein BCR39DRAFT_513615 [Naematelia encephala]